MSKKNIFYIIFTIIIFIFVYMCDNVYTTGTFFNDIKINNYEATLTINESGDLHIIERYNYAYYGDYSAKYRDIVTEKYNPDNPIYQSKDDKAYFKENIDVTSHVNVYIDGKLLPKKDISEANIYKKDVAYIGISGQRDELGDIISCSIQSKDCTSLFVYVKNGFTKDTVFEYNYTIKGAITSYLDIASLNWKLFEYNEANIKKGKVTINFPSNSKKEDLLCFARGAKKGGNIDIVNDNQILLTFENVNQNDALEIRALSNTNLYNNINPINKINKSVFNSIIEFEEKQAKEDNLRITIANILFYGTFGLIALMVIITILVYLKYDKEYKPTFDKEYLRELPDENLTPAEMSYLYYFSNINDEDVTATMLDLIRRKYINIEYDSNVTDDDLNYTLTLTSKERNNLKSHEKHFINWFFNNIGCNSMVTNKQIDEYTEEENNANQFMKDSKMFVKLAKEEGKKHEFIIDNSYKAKAYLFVLIPILYGLISLLISFAYKLDILFVILGSIACAVLYGLYVASIKKRTSYGAEEYAKWKAFKKFLEDFSEMEDYPIPGIIVWEQYLVYATSLKLADKVMKQLQIKLPEFNEENATISNNDNSTFFVIGYYRGYRRARFYYSLSSSFKNAKIKGVSTIAKANARRVSSGSGGGFSGGSSFGGGGGGGRSR